VSHGTAIVPTAAAAAAHGPAPIRRAIAHTGAAVAAKRSEPSARPARTPVEPSNSSKIGARRIDHSRAAPREVSSSRSVVRNASVYWLAARR
jgi:hypothetical protein